MVKILIGNKYSRIIGELPPNVIRELDTAMSYVRQGYQHTTAHKKNGWDGTIRMYMKGAMFMTGLLSFARDVLTRNGIRFSMEDRRDNPGKNFPDLKFNPPDWYEERPYQKFTVDRCLKFTRGIMQVATGGGKTVLATEIIARAQVRPFIYFVLSKDLMRQAHDTLSQFLNCEIGMVGDGKCQIEDITVCTIQTAILSLHKNDDDFNLKDYQFDVEDMWDEDKVFLESGGNAEKICNMIETCKGFYFDEVHHAAAKTCREVIFAADQAYYKIGGSATPVREDGEDMVIQALFGGRIVDITASYLTSKGYLVPAHIFYTNVEHEDVGEATTYREIYSKVAVDNDKFCDDVAKLVKFLNSNGISCLVLVQYKKHGTKMKKLIEGSEFLSGKDTSKKRNAVIDAMRSGDLDKMIATTLADEGLDIKPLKAVIMLSGGASVTRLPQRIGRCIRPDGDSKSFGLFFYFRHNVKFFIEQGRKAANIFKSEEEWEMHKVRSIDDLIQEVCDFLNSNEQDIFDAL
jgi:superfamily II DNA or RNA helicase